jgi:hypothetical protein
MTDRATLEALLARVLEGAGPDRELDADIEACLTGRVTHPRAPGWTFEAQDTELKLARLVNIRFISRASRPAPPYTASLDAALTLVPDGWLYEIYSGNNEDWAEVKLTPYRAGSCFEACAVTPARALIAACLKARMEALGD